MELLRSSLGSACSAPAQAGTLQDLFRTVHSIKGGSGFFDLDRIVWLADAMERVCARLLSGKLAPNGPTLQALRCAETALTDLLDAAAMGIDLVQGYEKPAGQELQNLVMGVPEKAPVGDVQSDPAFRTPVNSQLASNSWLAG